MIGIRHDLVPFFIIFLLINVLSLGAHVTPYLNNSIKKSPLGAFISYII